MCGIIGVLSDNEAAPILIEALKRLEYRGYDSAGIATINDMRLDRRRAVGKLVKLSDVLVHDPLPGKSGIGHTRWATHGAPNVGNAHPHLAGGVAVVHNGIIANFRELRSFLADKGVGFETDTDTETVALLANYYRDQGLSPCDAAEETIAHLEGAYALCFLFDGEDDLLIAARKGSPLAIGHGEGQMFVGSDAIALASLTGRITYLEEGDRATISRERFEIFDSDGNEVERPIREINIEPDEEVNPAIGGEISEAGNRSTSFDVEIVRTVASGNSLTIYLNLLALEDQVGAFVERVRGSNSLEPNQKDRYLTFLVQLQKDIGDLAASLPDAGEELSREDAETTAAYLEKYWNHLKENTEEFLSPERTAGLTVPLAIVAISTGIGTLFGQPLVGTIFGGWLAGKVSPEKVVGKVLETKGDTSNAE
jgi:hypothetical protein